MLRRMVISLVALVSVIALADPVQPGVVGNWRTTDLRGGSLVKEAYFIFRPDKTGGAFGVTKQGDQILSYEFTYECEGTNLQMKSRWAMRNGKRREYKISRDERFRFDPSAGEIVATAPHDTMRFKRASGEVRDPYVQAMTVPRKDLLVGVWRGGSEFGAHSLALSPSGDAFLAFAVGGGLGVWKVDNAGNAEVRVRDHEYGKETVLTAVYDVKEDILKIGDNAAMVRNLKIKPDDVIKSIKDQIEKRSEEERRRLDRLNQDFETIEETRHFENLAEVLSWLESGRTNHLQSVSFPARVKGLGDHFSVQANSSFVCCYLAYGMAEEGERPDEKSLRKIPWRQMLRPNDMPPNSVINDLGIAEIRAQTKTKGPIFTSDLSYVRVYAKGRMCKNELLVEWKAGEHRGVEAARILAPRFKGQFPCDLKVFTARRK